MRRNIVLGAVMVAASLLLLGTHNGLRADADDEALQEDYRQLEGTWETQTRDAQGQTVTVVKSERDRKSVVTAFDHEENVIHSHTSDFELKRVGDVRVFRYRNRTVTQGPEKGSVQKEPREYIYKIVGDQFFEIQGAMISQERRTPSMIVWKRRVNKEA